MHLAIDKHYIYERDLKKCTFCHKPLTLGKTTLDHYLPRSHGGTFDVFNLVVSCKRCNNYKRSDVPEDYEQIHLNLFKQAVKDRKILCRTSLPYAQLVEITEAVDRIIYQGKKTLFESSTQRVTVENNVIVNIIQFNRKQTETNPNSST